MEEDILTLINKVDEILMSVAKTAYETGKRDQYNYMIGKDIVMKDFIDSNLYKIVKQRGKMT